MAELATARAEWRRALEGCFLARINGKSFSVVVVDGRLALLDCEKSETEGLLLDPFGTVLGRDAMLLQGPSIHAIALRDVSSRQCSFLSAQQGDDLELNARYLEVDAEAVWVAAKKEGCSFLWARIDDFGVTL